MGTGRISSERNGRVVTLTIHFHLESRLRIREVIPPFLKWALMAWWLIKYKERITCTIWQNTLQTSSEKSDIWRTPNYRRGWPGTVMKQLDYCDEDSGYQRQKMTHRCNEINDDWIINQPNITMKWLGDRVRKPLTAVMYWMKPAQDMVQSKVIFLNLCTFEFHKTKSISWPIRELSSYKG